MPTRIPAINQTNDVWRTWLQQTNRIANTGLIFERYTQFGIGNNLESPWFSKESLNTQVKDENFKRIIDNASKVDVKLLNAWNTRWQAAARTARAEIISASTEWRFIPGFGQKNSLEIGFAFHRYGFPYLAGTSVKGITRTAAVIKIAELLNSERLQKLEDAFNIDVDPEEDEILAVQNHLEINSSAWNQAQKDLVLQFRAIFGTENSAGRAIFFSAIPEQLPKLERDILTPHFGKYYKGNNQEYPTDGDNPIPVGFLTVAAGQPFRFAIGWRGLLNTNLRDKAVEWLKFGLSEIGAGAKTTGGYGYFRVAETAEISPGDNTSKTEEPPPPPTPPTIEVRHARVARRQNARGSIVVIDEENQKVIFIAQQYFGGNTPAANTRIEIEYENEEIARVRIVR